RCDAHGPDRLHQPARPCASRPNGQQRSVRRLTPLTLPLPRSPETSMTRPRTGIQLLAGALALSSLTAASGLKPDAADAPKSEPAGSTAGNGTTAGAPAGTTPGGVTAP